MGNRGIVHVVAVAYVVLAFVFWKFRDRVRIS